MQNANNTLSIFNSCDAAVGCIHKATILTEKTTDKGTVRKNIQFHDS